MSCQYVQRAYAEDLLDSCDGTGVGYLLKDSRGVLAVPAYLRK
ncbi:hypothetical protein [[Kitasatospora] papulosa]